MRSPDDLFSHAANKHMRQTGAPVRRHDDEIDLLLPRSLADVLIGQAQFDLLCDPKPPGDIGKVLLQKFAEAALAFIEQARNRREVLMTRHPIVTDADDVKNDNLRVQGLRQFQRRAHAGARRIGKVCWCEYLFYFFHFSLPSPPPMAAGSLMPSVSQQKTTLLQSLQRPRAQPLENGSHAATFIGHRPECAAKPARLTRSPSRYQRD